MRMFPSVVPLSLLVKESRVLLSLLVKENPVSLSVRWSYRCLMARLLSQ